MDSITKFLLKLSILERNIILELISKIINLNLEELDVKKLSWKTDLFRIRKWKIRIIFKKENNKWVIIDINYRDKIYKKNLV